MPVVEFKDDKAKVTFQPPAGWEVAGGRTKLSLTPPNPEEVIVEMRIDKVDMADSSADEDLEKWSAHLLPKFATQIEITGRNASPFTLRGHPSREFVFSYVFQARRFSTSVALVDISPVQRVSLVVTASPAKFKVVRESAIRSMFTFGWQN